MKTAQPGEKMSVKLAIALIRGYQHTLSLLIGPCCRFYPSCSHYWVEALERHGLLRGTWLGMKRILRCHPFHPGGYDPVPHEWPVKAQETE